MVMPRTPVTIGDFSNWRDLCSGALSANPILRVHIFELICFLKNHSYSPEPECLFSNALLNHKSNMKNHRLGNNPLAM